MSKTITLIYPNELPQRLDVYLTTQQEYTRNFFHRLVARGDISVNDKIITKKSLGLKPGDKIDIRHPERYIDGEILGQSPRLDLHILREKKDYLIVYKPKGVLSHPNSARGVEHPNMVGALYHYFKEQNLPSTGNFIRAGLIHRLDKETDGLMLIAKTEAGLKYFKDLFQQKSLSETIEAKEQVPLKKFYRAKCLVTGQGRQHLSTRTFPHIIQSLVIPKVPHYTPKIGITKIVSCNEKGTPQGVMGQIMKNEKGKMSPAASNGVNDTGKECVTLHIEILTGRTHQIRYHLSQHGLPVIGDYLYMDKADYNESDPLSLTAYRLVVLDNEGEIIDVSVKE